MPVSLRRLREHTDQIKVPYRDEVVNLEWYDGRLTTKFYRELAQLGAVARSEQAAAAAQAIDLIAGKLAELIAAWDITEEEGPVSPDNPAIPIEAERIQEFPDALTLALFEAIMEEGAAGKAQASMSGGVAPVVPLASSPTGQHSFE